MQNYQNRSYTVQAKEMTFEEYLTEIKYELHDKAVFTRTKPKDKGYMVINPNVSERNVEGVDGHVSWLPEKAFHEVYQTEQIEPDDKDVIFIKVNHDGIYALTANNFTELLQGYDDKAHIHLLSYDEYPCNNHQNLSELLSIQTDNFSETHGKCWTGEPLLICRIDEDEVS